MHSTPVHVVISDDYQLKVFKKYFYQSKSVVYCDNPRFYQALKEHYPEFRVFDEFEIPEAERREINRFGRLFSSELVATSKLMMRKDKFDIGPLLFLRIGYIAVQIIKNYFYAESLVRDAKNFGSKIVLFESEEWKPYPAINGNAYLNYWIQALSVKSGIETIALKTKFKKEEQVQFLSYSQKIRICVKSVARQAINIFFSICINSKKTPEYLLSGSKRHLQSVLKYLSAHSAIGILDQNYQHSHYITAKNNGYLYRIPQSGIFQNLTGENLDLLSDLKTILNKMQSAGQTSFRQIDIKMCLLEVVFQNSGKELHRFFFEYKKWSHFFKKHPLKGLILDQDTTVPNSIMAQAASGQGVSVFCISHATLPVDFEVFGPQAFLMSQTIVNSEYEKQMYIRRGWNPSGLIVLGIPRFDEFLKLHETLPEEPNAVLYCGASMKTYWPERGGYLGMHITNNGDCQRQSLRFIFENMDQRFKNIYIKPHNDEGRHWPMFIKEIGCTNRTTFISHSEPFFRSIQRCGLIIMAHWSTAIIECVLAKRSVIVVDLFQSKDLAAYGTSKYVAVVRNAEELSSCMNAYFSEGVVNPTGEEFNEYLFGFCDGKNTQRSGDFILNSANQKTVIQGVT